MKQYSAKNIRNVALVGHNGSGKTSLAEAAFYLSGKSERLGRIPDGNTVCDFDPEEIKRKASVATALLPVEWEDTPHGRCAVVRNVNGTLRFAW